jgi:uncharacterized membrane protein YphA (DoxX/SURF4 family)
MELSPLAKGRVSGGTLARTAEYVALGIRLVLGALFVYAGVVKLMDPKGFARSISGFDLVPEELLPVVAIGLPCLELISGLGLVFKVPGSLTVICGMLLMFIVVLWYGILSGLEIDCGCFSTEELAGQASLWNAFYRDLIMLAGVTYLYVFRWGLTRRQQIMGPRARAKHIM